MQPTRSCLLDRIYSSLSLVRRQGTIEKLVARGGDTLGALVMAELAEVAAVRNPQPTVGACVVASMTCDARDDDLAVTHRCKFASFLAAPERLAIVPFTTSFILR
jgi:hypothetical protein